MTGMLLLDNYSVAFIDGVYCFFFNSPHCNQSRSARLKLKL